MNKKIKSNARSAHKLGLILSAILIGSCSGGGSTAPTPRPGGGGVTPPPASAVFTDVTAQSGINVQIGTLDGLTSAMIPMFLAHGVAAGDYDNDGDVDLFIVRGNSVSNLLFRNDGGMNFTEVAAGAGIAFTKTATTNYRHSSPAFADIDGDGDLDILLPGLENDPTMVFSNDGDGTFTDVTAGSGLGPLQAIYSLSPAFGDYDLDGDLDLMLGHWGTPRDFPAGPVDTEHLWRNDSDAGGIKFTSVSIAAGLSPSITVNADPLLTEDTTTDFTFTPTFARINDDAYPDILVVADFNFSQVFINNKDGTFTNSTDYNVIKDGNGMGSAVGDFDNDGDLDWFVSSIYGGSDAMGSGTRFGNRLYRNDSGTFTDVTDNAGVAEGGWGWGSCFIDFDNDGLLDLYHTNGWEGQASLGYPTDKSRLFTNNGNGSFTEKSEAIGLDDTELGRGIVCADFDNDGDVDILQLHLNAQNGATLWQNGTNDTAKYLTVKLQGIAPNTDGVGAQITIGAQGDEQTRHVLLGSNFASHNPTIQYFGVGAVGLLDRVHVLWPDGKETTLTNVNADQKLVIKHPDL